MGLRLRVIITLVAVIVPVTALFAFVRFDSAQRNKVVRRVERFANRIPGRMMNRCHRSPETFHFDRDRLDVFAYSKEFVSLNPSSPPFPTVLKTVGDDPLSESDWLGNYAGRTAIRTGAEGPCAILLVEARQPGRERVPIQGIAIQSLLVFVVLCGLGFFIAAPLVRRILRLKEAVEDAPNNGFDVTPFRGKDELAKLAEAFDASYNEIAMRDESLKAYVANTTHDLAIPLTVLQHRLRRLQNEDLGENARTLVNTTLEESHYIASLVANMSAAAKLGSDPKMDQFDLSEIIRRVVTRHGPIAAQKEIELNFAVPDEMIATLDAVLAEQAISNLVQNAIQYNAPGGHVAVVLDSTDAGFSLSVIDDGPGVSADKMNDLVDREARGDDARNRNPGGQGFGLSITKQVCDLHGWQISFEDAEPGLKVVVLG